MEGKEWEELGEVTPTEWEKWERSWKQQRGKHVVK